MNQPIYPQLRFGVDLLKLFPPWYLHPALKNLLFETRINTERRKEFTLEELFAQEENIEYLGYQNEILYLKDRLVSGKNILGLNASPGVHLWLLRNFLGLLPTPLFPKHNIRPNSWINISTQCKDTLIMMRIKTGTSNHLEDIIAREFCDLPPRNFTLIFELFELFRCLGTKLFIKTEVDKRSAMAIVRYFTPCLFSRPFRPGITTTTEKRLYALVLFAIFNWPTIKEKCQNILSSSFSEFEISKLYYLPSIKEASETEINEKINKTSASEEEIINQIKDNIKESSPSNLENKNKVIYLVENFTQTSRLNLYPENDPVMSSTPYETAVQISLEEVQNDNLEIESNISIDNNSKESYREKSTKDEENFEKISLCSIISNEVKIEKIEPGHKDSKLNLNKNSNVSINLFGIEPQIQERELIKFDKETLNTQQTEDKNIQVSTPKRNSQKICSSKLTKIRTNYKKDSQIIVLHINPCKCCKGRKKPKRKSRRAPEEFEDAEGSYYFEEKNNFESPEKGPKTQQVQNENLLDTPNFCCNYAKNINSNFDDTRKPYGWTLPCSSFENNNGFIYDSFVGSLHRESEYLNSTNFAASNPFLQLNSPKNEDLRERMAKIGWTYEDRSSSDSPRSKFEGISSRTDIKSQYKLCFDTEYKAEMEDSKESNFVSNLKKFGSKLNIFKSITPKFKRFSMSAENLISDVKYKDLTKRSNSI